MLLLNSICQGGDYESIHFNKILFLITNKVWLFFGHGTKHRSYWFYFFVWYKARISQTAFFDLSLPCQVMPSIQHFSYSTLAAGAICQNTKRGEIWPRTGDRSLAGRSSISVLLGCLWCSEPFSAGRGCLWGTFLFSTPMTEETRRQKP